MSRKMQVRIWGSDGSRWALLALCIATSACQANGAEYRTIDGAGRALAEAAERHGVQVVAMPALLNISEEIDRKGRYLSDALLSSIKDAGGIQVVEESLLAIIMAEQKLAASGFADPDSAAKIGKYVNADAVVIGRYAIDQRESCFDLQVRLVSVETRKVLLAPSVCVPKKELPDQLWRTSDRYETLDVPPFEGVGMRITVRAVERAIGSERVTAKLDLVNISDAILRVGFSAEDFGKAGTVLADDEGVRLLPLGDMQGAQLEKVVKKAKPSDYSHISPGQSVPLSITFETNDGTRTFGEKYDLNINLVVLADGERMPIPIGFKDLLVRDRRR